MPARRLVALFLVVTGCLASGRAEAQDECRSDEECVELYTEGFTCATGTLGRYCVEEGCPTCWEEPVSCAADDVCLETYGEGWACEEGACVRRECEVDADCASLGPAWRCVHWDDAGAICEEDGRYVPPFRSCSAAPLPPAPGDDPALALLAVLAGTALLSGSRRRTRV